MQPGPAVFTLEAVNALVPRLNAIVGQQLTRRLDIEGRLKKLAELSGSGDVPDSFEPSPDDGAAARELKHELAQGGTAHLDGVEGGAQDATHLRIGSAPVDVGALAYYALDEGFSARKPLAGGVKHRLLN